MPDVSVTLVLYNSRDHLIECLAALRPDVDAGTADVVAVDNASPDDSADVLQNELPKATIVRSRENLGFAGGCNLAWERVDARYWLLLNPDVVLDPGSLGALVTWMDDHAHVAMASPWLRDGERAEFPGRAFPSIRLALLEMARIHRLLPARRREALLQGPYVCSSPDESPEPGWLPATAVIVRSDAVRDVGLLDSSFFLYGEDLEWCWRMRSSGWRLAAAPVGGGIHYSSASSRRTWREEAVQERIGAGTLRAVAKVRGSGYARVYALVAIAAMRLEAWHPARSREEREHSRAVLRAWWKAFRAV
jgi:GT2 family glycosyltransferase